MDRALWYLLFLRLRGGMRQRLHGLRTLRGALLTLAGAAFVAGWVWLLVSSPIDRPSVWGGPVPTAPARETLPLVLLFACAFTVATTSGPAIYFNRAEVDFLFAGPFSRRSLLLYKFVVYGFGAFITAFCISAVMPSSLRAWIAVLLGTFLTLVFLQLLSAVLGLLGQTLAARLQRRWRWAVMGCGLLVLAAALGEGLLKTSAYDVLAWFRATCDSLAGRIVLAPFDIFARVLVAQTAEALVLWGALAAGVNALLLAGLVWLDAEYYEAVEASSRRMRQRWQQLRRGRLGVPTSASASRRIPLLPHWSGAGPLAWRQATTAVRTSRRPMVLVHLAAAAGGPALVAAVRYGLSPWAAVGVVMAVCVIFLPRMLLFDFRGDLEHLEQLKSLPLRPSAIVLGQLLTPTVLATTVLIFFFGMAALASSDAAVRTLLAAAVLISLPYSLFHYAVENLIFLCFPWRVVPVGRMDFEFFGRTLLESALKVTATLGCWLAAGLLSIVVYTASGQSRLISLAACWLFFLGAALLLVNLAARRFRRLNV